MKSNLSFFGAVVISGFIFSGCSLDTDTSSSLEQLNADLNAIDTYLASQGIVALKDINGIRFTIDSIGSGYPPRYNSTVTFSYTGKLLSGSTFQASTLNNVEVNGLITGLQIGLTLVPNGSKATFYIPSVYAYGSQAQNNIPANSNLIFEVFLKSITVTTAEKNQLDSDTAIIDNYLTSASVANVVKDSSGLRYVITETGTGVAPNWFNKVKVSYTGYIINSDGTKGSKFFEGSNEPNSTNDSRVVNYIRGFQLGLQQLPEGSKATLYIPSVMAFGSVQVSGGSAIVPPNSNLIYEVQLLEVLAP